MLACYISFGEHLLNFNLINFFFSLLHPKTVYLKGPSLILEWCHVQTCSAEIGILEFFYFLNIAALAHIFTWSCWCWSLSCSTIITSTIKAVKALTYILIYWDIQFDVDSDLIFFFVEFTLTSIKNDKRWILYDIKSLCLSVPQKQGASVCLLYQLHYFN